MKDILVMGVGNLLMGDEGVGVHAVRELEQRGLPAGVELVDGGTGGLHLLSYLEKYNPIVMIDATMDGREAGSVSLLQPKFASDFPRALSAHDIGLRDLVEAAFLLGPLPRIHLITISVDTLQPMSMTLSPPVRQAILKVVQLTHRIIASQTDNHPSA